MNDEKHITGIGNTRRDEPVRRHRRAYDCVKCQTTHYEFDPIFHDHIMHQSKHGWYFVDEELPGRSGSLITELLEALKAIVSTARTFRDVPKDEQEWTSIDDLALNQARAAIAKATGGAPDA